MTGNPFHSEAIREQLALLSFALQYNKRIDVCF